MMSLFQRGSFTLASGEVSSWKIECDALRAEDWAVLAELAVPRVAKFGTVVPVPRGGNRFAAALEPYSTPDSPVVLLVDDVFTTGGTITRVRDELSEALRRNVGLIRGVVAFARGPTPHWVVPLFSLSV